MSKCRQKLIEIYNEQFLSNLVDQSTNTKNRYAPIKHERIEIGDIILLKEPLIKRANYPMAIVQKVVYNDLDEATSIIALKVSTIEVVTRHSSSIIPQMRTKISTQSEMSDRTKDKVLTRSSKRKAAKVCKQKLKLCAN